MPTQNSSRRCTNLRCRVRICLVKIETNVVARTAGPGFVPDAAGVAPLRPLPSSSRATSPPLLCALFFVSAEQPKKNAGTGTSSGRRGPACLLLAPSALGSSTPGPARHVFWCCSRLYHPGPAHPGPAHPGPARRTRKGSFVVVGCSFSAFVHNF